MDNDEVCNQFPLLISQVFFVHPSHSEEFTRMQYADMLNDTERNEKYRKAIQKVLRSLSPSSAPSDVVVLDIGTGTGLLAIFSAQNGAPKVFACETHNVLFRKTICYFFS